MKDFKKRSLVLMLASVMTVTGSFASENYKNCIMDMAFKPISNNEISMVLSTKRLYQQNITPIKKDKNTYVIMLSEFDIASNTPDLSEVSGFIEAVDVKKMPYANGNKGYTRLTIRTNGDVNLSASSTVYIPSEKENLLETKSSNEDIKREINETPPKQEIKTENQPVKIAKSSLNPEYNEHKYKSEVSPVEYNSEANDYNKVNEDVQLNNEIKEEIRQDMPTEAVTGADVQKEASKDSADFQKYMAAMWAVLIIMISIFFYKNAQNRLRNVLGEKLDIDIKDEQKEPAKTKPKKKRKIYNTIEKIDTAYAKTAVTSMSNIDAIQKAENIQEEETLNIVDLDALFNEQSKPVESTEEDDEANEALDDFLSGFSFDDAEDVQNVENELFKYDEDTYEQVINNKKLTFNEDDIMCFNELLKSEISSEVINNPEKYLMSNPISPKKPSQESVLANLVTDYAINQNINFSADDIAILNKLLSVELDPDFITDLRTNPERTKEVEKEITEAKPKKQKPKEILTLKVSDMLPNLAEALKEQGNKPIEYGVKYETVYFSEGYDVSKLTPNVELPDLAGEVNNEKAYVSKPSEKIQIVDNTYANSVRKLTISGLPDLEDVMANPEKYEDAPQEEFIPDENELLSSIKDVQFKPFYDGTNKFEIINDDINEESIGETQDIEAIKNEFNQFDNFEVTSAEDDYDKHSSLADDNDDFESLYNESEYFDLDAIGKGENNAEKQELADLNRPDRKRKDRTKNENVEELLKKLEDINSKAENVKNNTEKEKSVISQENSPVELNEQSAIKCIIDGANYDIISTAKIKDDFGCHLARFGEKFVILAFNGNGDMKILKEYDSIKGDKIQARFSENSAECIPRFLVRVGLKKIIVELKNNELNYVMEL